MRETSRIYTQYLDEAEKINDMKETSRIQTQRQENRLKANGDGRIIETLKPEFLNWGSARDRD